MDSKNVFIIVICSTSFRCLMKSIKPVFLQLPYCNRIYSYWQVRINHIVELYFFALSSDIDSSEFLLKWFCDMKTLRVCLRVGVSLLFRFPSLKFRVKVSKPAPESKLSLMITISVWKVEKTASFLSLSEWAFMSLLMIRRLCFRMCLTR